MSGLVAAGVLHAARTNWCSMAERLLPTTEREVEPTVHRTGNRASDESVPPESSAEGDSAQSDSTQPRLQPGEQTRIQRRGTIEVVDLGTAEPSLEAAMSEQQQLAGDRGQRVLVVLQRDRCRPCWGLEGSLRDPRMQVALDGVRLVRVDLDVFREEIDALGWRRDVYPAFLLMGRGLSPRDTIHAGEWGQDIAANIAPVLGAFVRGRYDDRRYQFPPTTRSQSL